MKKRIIFVVSILLSCLFVSCKSTKNIQNNVVLKMDSSITQGTLENGMTYLIKENNEPKNRILLRLVVKAGSVNEDDDQKGVAHFVEHLAFNGTKNFKKNEIVDYFEKIGMAFGPEVNAYTTLEETVYMLEIPADDPKMLTTSLLVLHDWASEVTFEQEEIDKERGIIKEEWRLRQGVDAKIEEVQLSSLLKDSKYEKRRVLGDMDIISKVSRNSIVDFYKKWYKPENMAVVIVGDAKKDVLEKALKEIMNTIPKSSEPLEKTEYPIPSATKKSIREVKHTEQKYPIIQVFGEDKNYKPVTTYDDQRYQLALAVASSGFNQRLADLSKKPDNPWLEAIASGTYIVYQKFYNYMAILPKDNQFTPALQKFIDEYDRMILFGLDNNEFERIKTQILQVVEYNYTVRNKTPSVNHAGNMVYSALSGAVLLSAKDSYKISKQILNDLTLEEVNLAFKNAIKNRGTQMIIMSPNDYKVPPQTEIFNIWNNYTNAEVKAYEEKKIQDSFMQAPTYKGKIVSKKEHKNFLGKEYVLDNGIRIITKKTDFEKDTIRMSATSLGGLSLVSDKDYPSAACCTDYALFSGSKNLSFEDIQKIASTKNIGFAPYISNTKEGINANSDNKSLESIFQLTHLYFTQATFNDDSWAYIKENFETIAKGYGNTPEDVLNAKIIEILAKDNIRYAPITNDFVKKMNQKTSEKIYRERFSNPADFTFVFAGDFNETKLLDLCCTYLGSLKTTSNHDEYVSTQYNFPKGITKETVYKGKDGKGLVTICFGGKLAPAENVEQTYIDYQLINQLRSLLDIRLREIVREDKGGTYGISVSADLWGNKERQYEFFLNFGCEPKRQEELTQAILAEIEKIQKEGVSQEYIQKINEAYHRATEMNYQKNDWFINQITSAFVFKTVKEDFTNNELTITKLTTSETMQELANKYLNTKNYVCVYLKPEK